MTQSRYYSSTAVKTTLSLSIDAVATQIQVASDSGFPTQFPFTLILEKDTANEEIVTATSLVGANYAVTRGVDGTSAKSHAIGATVEHGVSALDFTDSRLHEGASANVHGIGATNNVVGTGTTQTLTNKTLTSPTVASPTITGTVSGSATYNNIVAVSPTINSGVLGTNLAAGLYRITNLGDPTSAQDAVTKNWAETGMSSQLALAQTAATNAQTASANASSSQTAAATSASNAATASANAATASANAATASANAAVSATNAQTASANAASSASNAATSAANAATASANAATASANASISASAAAQSAVDAAASAANAATAYDNFDDRYLGSKTADPTLDNDGNPLVTGALYFNSVTGKMRVYTGSGWIDASSASVETFKFFEFTASATQTTFSGNDDNAVSLVYTVGAVVVALNGVILRPGDDFTASNGSSIVLANGANANDVLLVIAYGNFVVADTYSIAQADATFLTQSSASTTYLTQSSASTTYAVKSAGYQYAETIYYTANGTFTKATYPWLRAIRVRVQAGGGGSGGCAATGANEYALGSSSGGGGYAERFYTNISSLSASVTVTVGSGGAGGAAGNNSGSNGGTSEFGGSGDAWRTRASGGIGGGGAGALAYTIYTAGGSAGGAGNDGDLLIKGGNGSTNYAGNANGDFVWGAPGGVSVLGNGSGIGGGSFAGVAGDNYGSGASGACNAQNQATARAGGAGGDGIVIVELYA